MPRVLVAALAASLALHWLALWLPVADWGLAVQREDNPPPLQAMLLPAAPVPGKPLAPPAPAPAAKQAAKQMAKKAVAPVPERRVADSASTTTATPPRPDHEPVLEPSPPMPEAGAPGPADFPPRGVIRYQVFRGEQGLEVGRATHQWEMSGERYLLRAVTETSGLAALIKPIRLESESRGRVGAQGLIPEHYRVLRSDGGDGESADFDWSGGQVKIPGRGEYPLSPGSQDLLSLHYHLAYLPHLENGVTFRVATGKKYELFHFDALGEEMLETPAGSFRTLHLQSLGSSRTEIWLALDHFLLPVKIRHTDRKGNLFDQVAVQLNLAASLPE